LAQVEAMVYDESVPPIWEQIARIAKEVPPSAWDGLPNDLSASIDEIVYRQKHERQ
jgi:hypothetical protein